MTTRFLIRVFVGLAISIQAAQAGAQQVRIVPTDGQPADSVTLGQTFQIKATMPGANPPPTVTVRLTTPSGSVKDVTLHRIGTENGVAAYGTGTFESIGGDRNARLVASSTHHTAGTINDLKLSNGEMVTAEIVGARGGPQTGASTSIPVYDNDIEQAIGRNGEMLDAIGESLVMQRNEANAVMTDPNAPPEVQEQAKQVRDQADAKLRELGDARQAIQRLETPLAKLRMGNKAITGLTRTDEVLDLSAPITDRDVVQDNMISLAKAATLSTYKILTDLTMTGALYKAGQGYVSFAMNEYWMNKFFGPKLKGLRDRMSGPAIDEFGRPITGADQRRAVGEIALGFFLMAKFPKFMDWLADGRPADIRIPGGGRPVTPSTGPRAGSTGSTPPSAAGSKPPASTAKPKPGEPSRPAPADDKTQVFPETGTREVSPGRRYTADELAADNADEIAENAARYDGNLKAAREAGVSDARIKEITSRGKTGDPDVADELGRAALTAQGKELDMPLGEYTAAKMFETRNRLQTLTENDYNWLRGRLAEDPHYLDKLPNRGRMLDDFDAAITPAQRGELLQNPRVRTMVDEAKAKTADAAQADGTATQRLPATDADGTPTVKLPAQEQPPGRPQTGGADPNATQRTAPPNAQTNPDATPTVRIPPPQDPGATTIITGPQTGGATQRMAPPTATTNPDATPTVKIPPPADPGATTIITRPTTGGATERMGPPTATTNPDATPTVKIPPPADPGATTIITRPTTGGATERMGPPTATTNPDATPTVKIPPPADPGATTIITRPTTGGGGGGAGATPPSTGGGGAEPTTIGVVPGGGFTASPSVPPIEFHIEPGEEPEDADKSSMTGGSGGSANTAAACLGAECSEEWNACTVTNSCTPIDADCGVPGNCSSSSSDLPNFKLDDPSTWSSSANADVEQRIQIKFGDVFVEVVIRPVQPAKVGSWFNPLGLLARRLVDNVERWRGSAGPRPLINPRDLMEVEKYSSGQSIGLPKGVHVLLTDRGGSTGKTLAMQVLNLTGQPVRLASMPFAIEPIKQQAQQRVQQAFNRLAQAAPVNLDLAGYCVEFLKLPPAANQIFRLAPAAVQKKYEAMSKVLRSAYRVQHAALLKPDSNPAAYTDSIKQWALWAVEQKFNESRFTDAFIGHTKKNVEAAGQQWPRQAEDMIRKASPNRWRDIVKIIAGAGLPVPQ